MNDLHVVARDENTEISSTINIGIAIGRILFTAVASVPADVEP